MPEYQYEIDKQNHLSIVRDNNKISVPGTFTVDRKNNLTYKLSKNKIWRQEYALPPALVFVGKWDLDKNHDLVFRLRKSGIKYKTQQIYFRGQIQEVRAKSLIFAVATKQGQAIQEVQRLKLQGEWCADKHNRLTFMVQRSKARYDPLTFKAQWYVKNKDFSGSGER